MAIKNRIIISLMIMVLMIPISGGSALAAEGILVAQADNNGANEKVVNSSYNPAKVAFHSPGHIQRWYNSPLRNQDAHLWFVFLIVLIIGIIVAAGMLYRTKQQEAAKAEEAQKEDKLFLELVAKQKRLMAKIADLDAKLTKSEISQEEYDLLRDDYKKTLVKVKLKLKELEEV
ncbi:MAG: hypothetical protein M0Z31_10695 [Clostridia bacterium]|nr:hypothetical protein [Clostridia bacterium]